MTEAFDPSKASGVWAVVTDGGVRLISTSGLQEASRAA